MPLGPARPLACSMVAATPVAELAFARVRAPRRFDIRKLYGFEHPEYLLKLQRCGGAPTEPLPHERLIFSVFDPLFDLDELPADLDDAGDDQLAVAADLAVSPSQ